MAADRQRPTVEVDLGAAQTLLLSGRLRCFEQKAVKGSPYWQSVEWLEKAVVEATGEPAEAWWKE